jgi:formate hydrogenlyase subunit 4
MGLLVLAKLSGSLALSDMLGGSVGSYWLMAGASLTLVVLSWFIVLLAENSRIPFDDPNTHLELTMIHEVMVLDHSGPAFGLILYGAALKLFAFGAIVVRVAVPVNTGSAWLDWPAFLGGMFLVAVAVGVVESTVARLRMTQVPILLIAACLLSGFGIVLLLR